MPSEMSEAPRGPRSQEIVMDAKDPAQRKARLEESLCARRHLCRGHRSAPAVPAHLSRLDRTSTVQAAAPSVEAGCPGFSERSPSIAAAYIVALDRIAVGHNQSPIG